MIKNFVVVCTKCGSQDCILRPSHEDACSIECINCGNEIYNDNESSPSMQEELFALWPADLNSLIELYHEMIAFRARYDTLHNKARKVDNRLTGAALQLNDAIANIELFLGIRE